MHNTPPDVLQRVQQLIQKGQIKAATAILEPIASTEKACGKISPEIAHLIDRCLVADTEQLVEKR